MAHPEFITHQQSSSDAWVCVCGNRLDLDGFHPCNQDGVEVEPVEGQWEDLYACDRCGRIIRQETLEVIGRRKEHQLHS